MTSGGNNFNHFAENQLTKFSARDAGDFSDAAGERGMIPKCGSLPRDAGDLVGLALLAGKSQPPYCIVVSFASFRGFLAKGGHRVYPLPNRPQWVPIYRQKFTALRSDLPSWITKKQEVKYCFRIQFPLDLCRAMTCHRAQGQTLSEYTVSVDIGLSNPDSHLAPDITSILYVACTRVPRLCNLFVSPIYPQLWLEKIGKQAADVERLKVDEKLRDAAEKFASKKYV